MHEPLLAEAALPAPTVVLGLLMRPYSLGHELFLLREENPLVTEPTKANAGHLLQAVWVCASTWDEAKRTPYDWLAGLKLKLLAWRNRGANIETQTLLWLAYRYKGTAEFPLSEIASPDKQSGRLPGAPFLLRLHMFAMEHLRLSESAAWDYPYGLAKMRWACYWEQQGGLDIYNDNEAEHDRFVREMEAKLNA